MTFPISRQGLEQIALFLGIGIAVFGVLTATAYARQRPWGRFGVSTALLGGFAALALILAYTVAPNIPTPPVPLTARFEQNPTPDTPETVRQGKEVYQANCAICHGPQARGDGPAALSMLPRPVNLQLHVPQHAPGEVHYWISNGITATQMPAWGALDPATGQPRLSDADRWSVVRYLQALVAGTAP